MESRLSLGVQEGATAHQFERAHDLISPEFKAYVGNNALGRERSDGRV
jgi:hypothetical protein